MDESVEVISTYGSIAGRARPNTNPTLPDSPTPSMVTLGNRLRSIPKGKLLHSDFINNMSSEGVSVVVALLFEDTDTTTWSETLTHNVAHTLLTLAPETLRSYFKVEGKMEELARSLSTLVDKLPTFEEDDLCPALVPDVVKDRALRSRCSADDLSCLECTGIISPFLRRFYPYSALRAVKALPSVAISDLVSIVQEPGYFAQMWRGTLDECIFDPPCWVTLVAKTNPSIQAAPTQTEDIFSDDEFVSEFDGFTPIKLLGLPQEEAESLPLDELRTRTLQSLPPILSRLMSAEETAQFVISFGTSPIDDLRRLLSTDGFRSKLNNIRGIPDPTPLPRRVYRIRLHVMTKIRRWTSYDELMHTWGTAVLTFLTALGFPIFLHLNPYDPAEMPLLLPVDSTIHLSDYAQSNARNTIDTCDIWCSTPFLQWGDLITPSSLGSPAEAYVESLAKDGLRTDCRESFTFGFYPVVALIGSDCRDRSILMIDEYMSCLLRLESDIPPFEIEWLSIGASNRKKHVMAKCVMATSEHCPRVMELFRRMERMTTSFDTHLIKKSMRLCFFPPADAPVDEAADTMRSIWDEQDNYEATHTRVILTEVPGIDPFLTPLPQLDSDPNSETPLSIAHTALMGGILDDDGEIFDIPAVKLTTDTAFTRYYLYSHGDDAQELIRHGQAFLCLLSKRLQLETPLRLCIREARRFTLPPSSQQDDTPHVNTIPPRADGSVAFSIDSDVMTLLQSMNQTITDMGREISSIKEQLRPTTIAEDVISAVQSSITTTAKELHSATSTSMEGFINHLMQHVQSYSWDIGTICHELNTSHTYSRNVLQDLVDRYDATALGSYDGTMAFGNELVMLRLAVTACAERINLLLTDRPDIPCIPLGDDIPMSPNTASRAMDAINSDYESGSNLISMVTVTDDPSQLNALTQDSMRGSQPSTTDAGSNTLYRSLSSAQLPLPAHTRTFTTDNDTDTPTTELAHTEPTTMIPELANQSSTRLTQDSLSTTALLGTLTQDTPLDNNAIPSAATTAPPPVDPLPTMNAATTQPHTVCHACGLAALAVCECCSYSFCDNCIHIDSDRGSYWCGPCRTRGTVQTSSSVDTSESGEKLTTLPSGTPAPSMSRETPTRRTRSRSESTLDSGDSTFLLHTTKSTWQSRRRRPRRRSCSPQTATSTSITSISTATPRSRSSQPTLHHFVKNKTRPRRANTKY
jgi:hypothetical protein